MKEVRILCDRHGIVLVCETCPKDTFEGQTMAHQLYVYDKEPEALQLLKVKAISIVHEEAFGHETTVFHFLTFL
jgi:hypothetical protein